MSRYCGEVDPEPICVQPNIGVRGLYRRMEVFSERSLWTLDNLEAVDRYYVNAFSDGEGTFFEKLKDQLAPTTPDTKQLVAEMLWVILLCPSNISAGKKREHSHERTTAVQHHRGLQCAMSHLPILEESRAREQRLV